MNIPWADAGVAAFVVMVACAFINDTLDEVAEAFFRFVGVVAAIVVAVAIMHFDLNALRQLDVIRMLLIVPATLFVVAVSLVSIGCMTD